MMRIFQICFFCGLLSIYTLFSAHAAANTALNNDPIAECKAQKLSAANYLRCLDRQVNDLTEKLTIWLNNKQFQLEEFAESSGHKTPLKVFKRSNSYFGKYMEEHCRWQYLMLLPDTASAAMRLKECKINLLQQRLAEMIQVGDSVK